MGETNQLQEEYSNLKSQRDEIADEVDELKGKERKLSPVRCAICHENPPNRKNVASRRCIRHFLLTFGSVLCIIVHIR